MSLSPSSIHRASQEAAAALRVQSLARGVSSRARVKLLRNLQQAVDIEQQLTDVEKEVVVEPEVMPPVVEAPAPASSVVVTDEMQSPTKQSPSRRRLPPREPPKQSPAHDVELRIVKTVNGTELDIVGTFVIENSTTDSSSQVVCQLVARDLQDNFESSLLINTADITSIAQVVLGNEEPHLETMLLPSTEPSNTMTNHQIQLDVFHRVCDGLECFISRKNKIMSIKYHIA